VDLLWFYLRRQTMAASAAPDDEDRRNAAKNFAVAAVGC
jgi:hypothetical protein